MLEKVADIKFNGQMADNKSGYKKSRFGSANAYNKSNQYDSIVISPAFHFMAKMNLRILNIFNSSVNKYEVVFELNNYIYDVIVDLNNFFEKYEIQFKINTNDKENKSSQSVFLKTIYDDEKSSFDISSKMIDELFHRIERSNFSNDSTLLSPEIMGFLIDGIEDELLAELRNISKVVIHFVEKLYELKITEKILNKKSSIDAVQIQLIKSSDFSGLQKSE